MAELSNAKEAIRKVTHAFFDAPCVLVMDVLLDNLGKR
jgi:hypothetical protein